MQAAAGLLRSYQETWRHAGPGGRWFLSAGFFYAVRVLVFSVSFPLFAKEQGFDPSQVGLLLAAVQVSLLVFGAPITRLGSRGHARLTLTAGPLIASAGIGLVLVAPDDAFWIVFAGCLVSGMASNVFWILGDPLLAGATPADYRARMFALKFALLTAGFGIGGALGGWIPGVLEQLGRSAAEALAGALVAVVVLDLIQAYCYRALPITSSAERAAASFSGVRDHITGKAMWLTFGALLVPEIGMAIGYNAIRPFLSLFFDEEFGMAPGRTGTIIGTMQLIGGVSALMIPSLAGKIGNVRTMALLRFAGGSMVLLALGATALPVVIVLFFLHYSMVDGTEAAFVAESMSRLPTHRRTVFAGMAAMLWSIASAIAATASGALQDATGGFDAAFLLGVCGFALSASWLVFVYPHIPSLQKPPIIGSAPRDSHA